MAKATKWIVLAALLALPVSGAAQPAATWLAEAGWTRTDTGLDAEEDGILVGAGRTWNLPDGVLDVTVLAEYVQRSGSQPRLFADPQLGTFFDDDKVRLHYLQPTVLLGLRMTETPFVARTFVGLSAAMKLAEDWIRPVEDGNELYAYEDYDFLGHIGASIGVGPALLEARYCFGMVEQLIVIPNSQDIFSQDKAEDPLAGAIVPEDGAKLSNWQVAAVWKF